MKIQPLDAEESARADLAKPAGKSRWKRLFERQFPIVSRISSSEKLAAAGGDPDPSSVCLDGMVLGYIEEPNGKPSRCGRRRCNCFHCDDASDDDLDFDPPLAATASEILKGLISCASVAERNLLADASRIMEKAKIGKNKLDLRLMVSVGLRAVGYDAAVCKSRWEKTPSFPAGEHEYIDVIVVSGDRVIVDVDFRSEFEIVRSTKSYRAALQSLPSVFVGTADRLQQIVGVVSAAATESFKEKRLHLPPWRKPEYMWAKWLSPYQRSKGGVDPDDRVAPGEIGPPEKEPAAWEPPAVRPKAAAKPVTGLASVLRESETVT